MNTRLLVKLIVVLAVMLFMVMMGIENTNKIQFTILHKTSAPVISAIMYFIFFGVGVITGGILTAGSGKKSSGPKS